MYSQIKKKKKKNEIKGVTPIDEEGFWRFTEKFKNKHSKMIYCVF
jgi:hypothetical protein